MTLIKLPPTLARCPSTRTGDCGQSGNCARAQAPHEINRPSQDYTQETNWKPLACLYFLPVSVCRVKTAAPAPIIHDAPKGLK